MPNQAIPNYSRTSLLAALLAFLVYSILFSHTDNIPESLQASFSPDPAPATVKPAGHPLRILVPVWPGAPEPSPYERELLDQFAASENLTQMWIPVKDFETLLQKLAHGEADMATSLRDTIVGKEGQQILNTLPWAVSRRQVVGRAGSVVLGSLSDLTTRQVVARQSSPVWPLLAGLARKHPGMELLGLPDNVDNVTVLERVKTGRYDLAVVDSLLLPEDLEFSHKLKVLLDLSGDMFMKWGVSPNAMALHSSLNQFLNKKHLELESGKSYREDFVALKQRKLLRLITYRDPVNYFHDRGRLKGFEYDLLKRFAEKHKMRLDVVLANTQAEMQQLLNEGKGDVIAASVPESQHPEAPNTGITRPYNYSAATLVGRKGEVITDIHDLEGRVIRLAASSPYLKALQGIRDQGINFSIILAEPDINTEMVLFSTAQGIYDLAVIGSHEVKPQLSRQLNLQSYFTLGDSEALVWMVRKLDSRLLAALNGFIESEYKKGFYNVLYARYIEKPDAKNIDSRLFAQMDQISPYDDIVHKYADHYSFDWRLIVALMYQESRFNPRAISTAGAEGLMQVLPATAKTVGAANLNDPDNSIYVGVRYLDQLRSQFENELSLSDRLWFALAAYNAGFNRVQRARRLAEKMNLDKNQWFNNVELAMLELARPYIKDGEQVKDCSCGQTVIYVREIQTLYNNYLRLTRSVKAVAKTELPREKS